MLPIIPEMILEFMNRRIPNMPAVSKKQTTKPHSKGKILLIMGKEKLHDFTKKPEKSAPAHKHGRASSSYMKRRNY